MPLATIGFDADDTLWQNETFFQITQARFAEFLADFADPAHLADRLHRAEARNLAHYGFGIKGFTLSMIETAIEVTEGRVPARVLKQILDAGREMHAHPIELLPGARETIAALAPRHRILLVTKGDLLDQERKLAQSGLGPLFHAVEIVSDKTPAVYARIFGQHAPAPDAAMMVGNSLKSDVLPALAAGGWATYVPHALTWAYEHAEEPEGAPRYARIAALADLPALVGAI
jgi:putative hydrolase of the HAD superfamily